MGEGVRRLMLGFLAAFMVAAVWTGYWVVWKGPSLSLDQRNPRLTLAEGRVARGGIYDRKGEPLVVSVWNKNAYQRVYKGPLSAVQTIGYMHTRFGKTGLEKTYDAQLRGSSVQGSTLKELLSPKTAGVNIKTTLDSSLQLAAEKAMKNQRGAVVVLNANTGAILASVSVPNFDPANMDDALFKSEDQALFNRALQGRYTPGSCWKPVVLAAALESRAVAPDEVFVDNGSIQVGDHEVHNFEGEVLGAISLKSALIHSSNVAFVQIGMKTSGNAVWDLVTRMGITDDPGLPTAATTSHLPSRKAYEDKTVRAQAGFGQGSLWVSPLDMAIVAASIGNGGYAVKPYLVETVGDQNVAPDTSKKQRIMPAWVADFVRSAMRGVVTSGTGRRAAVSGISVAGKTGTAENPQGEAHAWFIAYAPADKPTIALAVVLENSGGTGGTKAAPIAAQIIQAALKKK